jgi:rhodanese-related sulfurtransferase
MRNKGSLVYISPDDLARWLAEEPKLFLLDVRNPQELEGELGRLPGAVNIPLQQLEQRLAELSTQERKDIVVLCRTGKRSETAARKLQEAGNVQVFVLKGGMMAWRDTQR